jgi:hypothetical protein
MIRRAGRAASAVRSSLLIVASVCALALVPHAGRAATGLGPDAAARLLSGMLTSAPSGVPVSEAKLADYSGRATAQWQAYERRIGQPMQQWAATELVQVSGGTVFYPFSGPDFGTVHRMYPQAGRYVLVAMQRAEPPPALDRAHADDLASFMSRFAEAWEQFSRIGFFRTLDLDEEARQQGLRAGATTPMIAFAVRSGFTVESVEPIRISESGSDVEPHPGPRSERSTWNSVRIVLRTGNRRVLLDYVRLNLSDAHLEERPGQRAWVERMAGHPTVLKAASHLLQTPRFSIVRDALLERAPSILQDETGIEYTALTRVFDVALYGRFTKPHALFNPEAQLALAQAYQTQKNVKPLTFRVSYQRQPEANLQVANRKPAAEAKPALR